jgi:predicted NAD-dependent protein-ADP-ribosyltransferase YbiA (DUF1768 family)
VILVKCLHKELGAEHLEQGAIYIAMDSGMDYYRILDPYGYFSAYYTHQFEIIV